MNLHSTPPHTFCFKYYSFKKALLTPADTWGRLSNCTYVYKFTRRNIRVFFFLFSYRYACAKRNQFLYCVFFYESIIYVCARYNKGVFFLYFFYNFFFIQKNYSFSTEYGYTFDSRMRVNKYCKYGCLSY